MLDLGADLSHHDPYVGDWQINDIPLAPVHDHLEEASNSALTVVLQDHDVYDLATLVVRSSAILDCRGRLSDRK